MIAAKRGAAYALYYPDGGEVALDLRGQTGQFDVRWVDIATGESWPRRTVAGGELRQLAAPAAGPWGAAIMKTI